MEIKLTWSHFLTQYLMANHDGEWERHDGTFESIEWRNGATPPLEADVEAGIKVIQDDWEAQEYARNRKEEYPEIADQLDMIYWDGINETTTHKDAIDAIKTKYPKP